MGAAQRMRGAHPQHAFRFGAATRQRRFGLINFSQDALGSFEHVLPLFGQGQAASAAGDKAHFGQPSNVASRLLTTLSARPISRLAAERLPAAAIRTKVRSPLNAAL